MRLKGSIPLSMVDWPGKLAAVLFTGGCNFRCRYCHNAELIFPSAPFMDEEEVLADLWKRKVLLDGVVITGGEPTLQPDLEGWIERLRGDGWLIKLDTNGSRPEVVKRLLEKKLLDYIAMDWKTPLTGPLVNDLLGIDEGMTERVAESAAIVAASGVEAEWRTTCSYGIDREALVRMEEELRSIVGTEARWYWQKYSTPEQGDPPPGLFSLPLTLPEAEAAREHLRLRPELRSWS